MSGNKFHRLYINICDLISQMSYAKRLKVGCIIVKNDSIISYGYNGTPHGDDNVCETECNTTKEDVIHAEINAILKLTKTGASDCCMYITHSPCLKCANLIFQSGVVSSVFYRDDYRDDRGIKYLISKNIPVEQINIT